MRKTILLLFLLASNFFYAQVSNEGRPKSWKFLKEETLKPVVMPSFDLKVLEQEDAVDEKKGDKPWRFGKEFLVDYNLTNSGEWTILPDGSRIWRIRFVSKGAKTLNFLFEDFYLPTGATVYLYSNDREDLLGAYTHEENNENRILGSWLIKGDDVWIEYYEPAKQSGNGALKIGKVVHGYRTETDFAFNKNLNNSDNCNQDVDCPIDPALEEFKNHNKKGVTLLMVGNSGFCTGSLINNTTNNGVPYILTADHCYSNPATWSFRFNWISPNPVCSTNASSTNGPTNQVMSGASLRARRADSDFLLLELNNNIPSTWDVVWNGWNRSTNSASKTFGIHHPSGDIMKVSVGSQSPVATSIPQDVWLIESWELGVTEGGSSGSPLFDQNGYIIGQLLGGTSECVGNSNNGGYDVYGRLDSSWNGGGTPSTQLKHWLDPSNSGVITQNPYPAMELYGLDAQISITNIDSPLCDVIINPILVLRNNGSQVITSVNITYQLSESSQQVYNWTGSLAQDASVNIPLDPIEVTMEGNITASIVSVNNTTDENSSNNTYTKPFTIIPSYQTEQVLLSLQTDEFANETMWQLKNSEGTVLYSGGPYSQDNILVNAAFNLDEEDCYTFTISDSEGDGICCDFGNGYYRLELPNGQVIKQGGDFGIVENFSFSNKASLSVGEINVLDKGISVYPNPANEVINISNTTGKIVTYEIFNVAGQIVGKGHLKQELTSVEVNFASGVYIIKCIDVATKESITKKVLIK